MSFYHFTSSDSGAPTLNGVDGAGITLLDWIIVTKGGGTKLFSDTNKAVYQLAGGSGRVLRAEHAAATSGTAQRMTVRCAISATDVDTLVNPYPTVALESNSESVWTLSTTSNSTARAYWGIVSDTYMYLVVQAAGGNACYIGSFGDFAPAIATDGWNGWITINGQASNSTGYFFGLPSAVPAAAQARMYLAADINGTVKSTIGTPVRIGAQSDFGSLPVSHGNAPTYPAPYDAKLHLCEIAISCYGSQSSTAGTYALALRGWLPNIWQPLHAQSLIATGDTFSASGYSGSASFTLASASTSSGAAGSFVAFETTNTWAAP